MTKKYFEVTEPYFALIRAEDTEEVAKIYQEGVADIGDHQEFIEGVKEVSRDIALITFVRNDMTLVGDPDLLKEFNKEENQILAIDSWLL